MEKERKADLCDGLQARLERLCVERSDRVILNTSLMRDDFRAAYPAKPADEFLCFPTAMIRK